MFEEFEKAKKIIDGSNSIYMVAHINPDGDAIGSTCALYFALKSIGKDARKRILKNSEFFCQAWGNEGQQGNFQPEIYEFPERYIKYQTAIREIIGEGNLYPIEFDYVVWK